MLDPSQFITRTPLDAMAFQFINKAEDFVAMSVLPPKPIDATQKKVYQYDTSMLKIVQTEGTSKSQAGKVDYGVFPRNITTTLHKLGADVDPKDEVTFDRPVAAVRRNQARNIWHRLMLSMEQAAITLVTTSSNYPAALTSALTTGTNRWIDAGGDPEGDRATVGIAVRNTSGKTVNAACMARDSFDTLRTSPVFRERMKYTTGFQSDDAFMAAVKAMLGVQYLFLANARYDSANDLITPVIGSLWDDSCLFFYHNPSPELEDISFGHTYIRKELYSYEAIDPKRGGPDGRIVELEAGWEWVQASGFIVGDNLHTGTVDTDFAAGYLLRNIV